MVAVSKPKTKPRYKIVKKRFNEWSSEERRKLKSLSLRSDGLMSYFSSRYNPMTYVAIKNGYIYGWCILAADDIDSKFNYTIMVYVRKKFRRMGIDKKLVTRAMRGCRGDIKIYKYEAWCFFDSIRSKRLRDDW